MTNNETIVTASDIEDMLNEILGENDNTNATETDSVASPIETDSDGEVEESLELEDSSIPTEEEHTEEPVEGSIPLNSESLQVDESTSRFSSAIWYDKIRTKSIMIAGVGGIGSYVGFLLARMKPARIYLFDDDIVEEANMSGQLYSLSNVGMFKVDALSSTMRDFGNYYGTYSIQERYSYNSSTSDIMICGFDNMEARRIYFNKWLERVKHSIDPENCLFIDGRLAAEEFQVFCIKGDDTYNIERYGKEFLFSDDEAEETICSYKQTTFCANMIASVMVNLFTNFVANECDPLIPRDLPFMTRYDASTMYFKTEE